MIAAPPAERLRGARNVLRQPGHELVALSRAQDLPEIADIGLNVGMLAARAEHLRRELAVNAEAESIGLAAARIHTWLPDDDCRGDCPHGRCDYAEDLARRESER